MRHGIALGSNLDDRLHYLRSAVRLVLARAPGARLMAAGSVYETAPVDCPDGSGAFYNSVIELECELSPHELHAVLRQIEHDLGRPDDHPLHAPRMIDLDLLYADEVVIRDARLVLPHPRIAQRRFVLQPLADIRPDLVLPGQTKTVAQLLEGLRSEEPPLHRAMAEWL